MDINGVVYGVILRNKIYISAKVAKPMSKALKFGLIMAMIFVFFLLIILITSGEFHLIDICYFAYIFIGLTIFFWLVYIVSKAIGKTEKTIWDWIREE